MKTLNFSVFLLGLCLVRTGLAELPLKLPVADDYADVIYRISYSQ